MDKTIKVEFSYEGLGELIDKLEAFKESLYDRTEEFAKELAEIGVKAAEHNAGNFGKYILFQTDCETTTDGVKAYVLAIEQGKIISTWNTAIKGQPKSAEVSPLLLAEFGSGIKAKPAETLDCGTEVGQGTFPGQTHAFDREGWYWQTVDGVWHWSNGVPPTEPMYHAYEEMRIQIETVAKNVFGRR